MDEYLNLTGIAAVITVASLLVYVLGFIALFWPIYTKLTKRDVATAYAESVVSKTVVAGQGVWAVVGYPLLMNSLLLMILILCPLVQMLVGLVIGRLNEQLFGGSTVSFIVLTLLLYLLVIEVILAIASALKLSARRTFSQPANHLQKALADFNGFFISIFNFRKVTFPEKFRIITITVTCAGVLAVVTLTGVMELSFELLHSREPHFQSLIDYGLISGWNAAYIILVIFFAGAFIGSVPEAVSHNPPLPKAEITLTDENGTVGGEIIKGTLLDHSTGVWHLLDSRNDLLTAIPDGRVEKILILK